MRAEALNSHTFSALDLYARGTIVDMQPFNISLLNGEPTVNGPRAVELARRLVHAFAINTTTGQLED